MKIRGENSVTFPGSSMQVEDLRILIETAPESATVRFTHSQGDRPFESGTTTITVSWESDL